MINLNSEAIKKANYLVNDLFDGNIDTFKKIYDIAKKQGDIETNNISIKYNYPTFTSSCVTVKNLDNLFFFKIRINKDGNYIVENKFFDAVWENGYGISIIDFEFMKELAYCLDALHELIYWSD